MFSANRIIKLIFIITIIYRCKVIARIIRSDVETEKKY